MRGRVPLDINGKVALITGGARMGGPIGEALARRGGRVVLSYRSSLDAAREAADRVRVAGGECEIVEADLSEPNDVAALVGTAAGKFGRLDVLINMASMYKKTPVETLTAEMWDRNMNIDARAAYLASLAAAPIMREHGGGRIINFSDWLAESGRPRYFDYVPYYAAKHAVIGLTEALALELAPDILVNAIAPGPIVAPEAMDEKEHEAVKRATPLGRWGGVEEIAKAVLFLIETDYVTGETIRVDGGRHLS